MASARAIVFANGEYSKAQALRVNASNADYLVCVDGGIRHCLSEGLKPDLLVGDSDSLDKQSAAIVERLEMDRMQYPAEKDTSDLELALDTLSVETQSKQSTNTNVLTEVIVLGASGGRSDHHLFNWQLLGGREWPFSLRLVDDYVEAQVVDSSCPFDKTLSVGQTFSVVPVAGVATGVNVIGARYSLNNASLKPGSTLGLSNLVSQSRLQVSVLSGIVWVMTVHKEH